MSESTLYRVSNRSFCTIHLANCRYAKTSKHVHPWLWAEGRTLAEVLHHPWNKPCATCFAPIVKANAGIADLVYVVGGKVQMTRRLPRPRHAPVTPVRSTKRYTGAEFAARLWTLNREGISNYDQRGRRIQP